MKWLKRFFPTTPSEVSTSKPERREATFKDRVDEFWEWFSQNSGRFFDVIEAGRCGDLTQEVSDQIHRLFPHFGWVFGPGEDRIGHSFTLTPEAEAAKAFLAEYWLSRAPDLENWTFYDARQPGITDGAIRIHGENIDASAIWVTLEPDEEAQRFDLTVWHPAFSKLQQKERFQILFIWLDEILGEKGTAKWIGAIEFSDSEFRSAVPLKELRETVQEARDLKGWNSKDQIGIVYELKPKKGRPREDTFVGSTSCELLIQDYFKSFSASPNDPVVGCGAHFVFLAIDNRNIQGNQALAFRYELGEEIGEEFRNHDSGLEIGGAVGTSNLYIDLLLFDGENSIQHIRKVLHRRNFAYPVILYPFYDSFGDPIPII